MHPGDPTDSVSPSASSLAKLVWALEPRQLAAAAERHTRADDAVTLATETSEADDTSPSASERDCPEPPTTQYSTPTDRLAPAVLGSSWAAAAKCEEAEDDGEGSFASATEEADFSLDSVPPTPAFATSSPPPAPVHAGTPAIVTPALARPLVAAASHAGDYFSSRPRSKGKTPVTTPGALLRSGRSKLGWIGLSAHGASMALYLSKLGFYVVGWDADPERRRRFCLKGGDGVDDVGEAVEDAQVIAFMGLDADGISEALIDRGLVGSPSSTRASSTATVIIFSSMSYASVRSIARLLEDHDHEVIDAPVSGSVFRASRGDLDIIASQAPSSSHTSLVLPLLKALTDGLGEDDDKDNAKSVKLRFVPGGVGTASAFKSVLSLVGGCHLLAAAEALAFSVRLGLSPRHVHDRILSDVAFRGRSNKLVDRGGRMLHDERHPENPLSDYVRDLSLVVEEAAKVRCPVWMASTALQRFLLAKAAGWGNEDDSGVVRLWTKVTGEPSVSRAAKERATKIDVPRAKTGLPRSATKAKRPEPKTVKREEVELVLPPAWEGDANGMVRSTLTHCDIPVLVVILDTVSVMSLALRGKLILFVARRRGFPPRSRCPARLGRLDVRRTVPAAQQSLLRSSEPPRPPLHRSPAAHPYHRPERHGSGRPSECPLRSRPLRRGG